MNNALAIYQQFDQLQNAANALQASGFFPDVKTQAQAIVKVMAGAELGLPPFASMTGINIIQGKPALGANIIATLVKNDSRYDYRIKQADNKACVLEWYENGKRAGEAGFTIEEAQTAGLTGKDNWRKYTSDMLFARAISRGARRFAPGIFGGSPVYTPDELGADTDPDGYIDAVVVEPEPEYQLEAMPDETPIEPAPTSLPLTWQEVQQVTNAKGEYYASLPTDTLSYMLNEMLKLNKPEHAVKIDAAKKILERRNREAEQDTPSPVGV